MRNRILVTATCNRVVEIVFDAHCGGLVWDIRRGRGRSAPFIFFFHYKLNINWPGIGQRLAPLEP